MVEFTVGEIGELKALVSSQLEELNRNYGWIEATKKNVVGNRHVSTTQDQYQQQLDLLAVEISRFDCLLDKLVAVG